MDVVGATLAVALARKLANHVGQSASGDLRARATARVALTTSNIYCLLSNIPLSNLTATYQQSALIFHLCEYSAMRAN